MHLQFLGNFGKDEDGNTANLGSHLFSQFFQTDIKSALPTIAVKRYLDHQEPRVREAARRSVVVLSSRDQLAWDELESRIVALFLGNLSRQDTEDTVPECQTSDGTVTLAHETVGWKALESTISSIDSLLQGIQQNSALASDFSCKITKPLLWGTLRFCAIHSNRFVRQKAFEALEKVIKCFPEIHITELDAANTKISMSPDECFEYCQNMKSFSGETLSSGVVTLFAKELLSLGLMDNWSQVRYASTSAAASLLRQISPEDEKYLHKDLLPRICLNRYYVAAGVRNQSQSLWQTLFPAEGDGQAAVVKNLGAFVEYFVQQADADNHAVREAACHCISELSLKLPTEPLRPYVLKMLNTLLECFDDDSWPVRDAACVATGKFVTAFPTESRVLCEEKLIPRWKAHLWDNIWSVRKNSAISIRRYLQAYGEEVYPVVEQLLQDYLPSAKQQPKESKE